MFSNQPAELVLPTPLRTCCPVSSSPTTSRASHGSSSGSSGSGSRHQRYLAGSATSAGENALYLLRYHESENELGLDATLAHPTGEVWCLSGCPRDGSLVVTCGGGGNIRGNGIDAAKDLLTLGAATGVITRWDLAAGAAEVGRIAPPPEADGGGRPTSINRARMAHRRAAWDPHHADLVAVAGPHGVSVHDLREASGSGGGSGGGSGVGASSFLEDVPSSLPATSRGRAGNGSNSGLGDHRYGTTDVSYNPNLPHVLATAGRDGLVKFWDLRKANSSSRSRSSSYSASSVASSGSASDSFVPSGPPSPTIMANTNNNKPRRRIQPIKALRGGHAHWSQRVLYNPHHDQLVLSSGTDGVVNLWRVGTVSSSPLMLDLDSGGRGDPNGDGGENDHDIIGLRGGDDDDDDDDDDENRQDGHGGGGGDSRVSRSEFPHSVYDLCWSSADAWTFLAVGYDGTASLNHVPSREKYKILL